MKAGTKIKVVGVGGSGSNAISRMVKYKIKGVDLIAINTDAQALRFCLSPKKVLIGENTTKGLGTGMDTVLGEKSAKESRPKIEEVLKGAEMVFIASGLGGGTGSSVSPIVAEISKNLGALTIAVVTTPFSFEGGQRKKIAGSALEKLKEKVDTLLVVPNDKVFKSITDKTKVSDAFWVCDEVLREAVEGITDLIFTPGIINVDFADIKSIMKNAGKALFGVGRAAGENRVQTATVSAISSPLLDFSIEGAGAILFSVAGKDLTLFEINTAAKIITKNAAPQTQIIFGAIEDKRLKNGEIKITVIATRFLK